MRRTFTGRRIPRKIGSGEDDDGELASASSANASDSEITGPAVVRSKVKSRKTNLRKSLGRSIAGEDDSDDDTAGSGVVTPKKINLTRIAVQRSALQKRPSSLIHNSSRFRQEPEDEEKEHDEGKPSYSAADLQILKDSTPTTPQDVTSAKVTDNEGTLDVTSKFGSDLSRYDPYNGQSSAIPSEIEIAEKKARRARLAGEQRAEEYITLDLDDPGLDDENVMHDDFGRLVLKPKDKWGQAESRLVAEDEDILENFDEFTNESGRIPLGEHAQREAERRKREDMKSQIALAEGGLSDGDKDESTDDSEIEWNAAFEDAQTRHGTYSSNTTSAVEKERESRARTPSKITGLPTLDIVLERLRRHVLDLQSSRMQRLQEMDALQREKVRIGEEEIRIQRALRDTAEKFEALRKEKGFDRTGVIGSNDVSAQASAIATRDVTPMLVTNESAEEGAEASMEGALDGHDTTIAKLAAVKEDWQGQDDSEHRGGIGSYAALPHLEDMEQGENY